MGGIKETLGDLFSYPQQPGFKERDTSREAAMRIASTAETIRGEALRTLAIYPQGLTADEIARIINRSVLAVRPRVSELYAQQLIEKTGVRRTNKSGMSAAVWRTRA